jgi:HEAT repeat protein
MSSYTSNRRVYGIATIVVTLAWCCSLFPAENPVTVHRERFSGCASSWSVAIAKSKCSSKGYPTDTVEQIMAAIESPNDTVRMTALTLLVARVGEEAIPVLKKVLSDKDVLVRKRAAELLGSLGDASGVPVLRADYDSLVAKHTNHDPNKADPNVGEVALKRADVFSAMSIAQVLVEFGDTRGFEQAARILAGDNWAHRLDALKVLFEINMWIDRTQLLAEKRDPEPLLIRAAESEKQPHLLREFLNDTLSNTRGTLRRTLLEKVEKSSNAPEEIRNRARDLREDLERTSKRRK